MPDSDPRGVDVRVHAGGTVKIKCHRFVVAEEPARHHLRTKRTKTGDALPGRRPSTNQVTEAPDLGRDLRARRQQHRVERSEHRVNIAHNGYDGMIRCTVFTLQRCVLGLPAPEFKCLLDR